MATYVLLTRVEASAMATHDPLDLEQRVKSAVAAACPSVRWKESFAILGPYDYLDLFEAPDSETAAQVSQVVRREAEARTEVWPAITWEAFKRQLAA